MARRLRYFVTVSNDEGETHTFGPDDKLPAWASKAITNPSAWDDAKDDDESASADFGSDNSSGDDSGSSGDDGGGSGEKSGPEAVYSDMTVPELKAKIAERNEGRDEDAQVKPGGSGNKPDLVKALVADDAK